MQDFKPLEHFPVKDVCGAALVNEDLGHHEIGDYNRDNHDVILVDTLEVSISKSDRRGTS